MCTVHPVRADWRLIDSCVVPRFPSTRYQGSKRRLAAAIVDQLHELDFVTVLDAFGGTGAVAYAFKRAGKQITYNDELLFNHQIGLALIENESVRLTDREIATVGVRRYGVVYGDFIERAFDGIYFTRDENRWLDVAAGNILATSNPYKRALSWFALFQSAMAKRPYNLFHRSNLYMRTAAVRRSFGNKATWDRSFDAHFCAHALEANAAVMEGQGTCRAICRDALQVEEDFDLVYIDTPYINSRGIGVDYQGFYHFLEGMVRYADWPSLIDRDLKHRPLRRQRPRWSDPVQCYEMFRRLFDRFRDSILVVSYRSDGIPTVAELRNMLRAVKKRVRVVDGPSYQYALSTNRRSREVLLIATA